MSEIAVRKRQARKVRVKRSAKRIYIPIDRVAPNILRPHEKFDACVVKRGPFGWSQWHECQHHLIYIEEAA